MADLVTVRDLILASVKLPAQLVSHADVERAVKQALIKLNQRTGGQIINTQSPLPGMTILRDPVLDPSQVYLIATGLGLYVGQVPWTLANVDQHQGAWRYFIDLAVEYTHVAVCGRLAIADGFNEMPFNLEFRSIYEQAFQRIADIDRDIQENWLIGVI